MMQRRVIVVIVLALSLSLGSAPLYAQKVPSRPIPGSIIIDNNLSPVVRTALEGQPRMDGSTTAVLLGQLLAARALGLNGQVRRMASESRWPGAASSAGVVFPLESSPEQMAKYQQWLQREAKYSGTNSAYMALINDGVDLIVVAREPSPDELKAAGEKGVQLDARPIGLDAFVFLVNTDNNVASLTLDQLRGIYVNIGADNGGLQTGRIRNWQELGGADRKIHAFTRNRNSGSEELMEKYVLQGRKIITGGDRMMMSMMGPIEGVSRNPDSIAYSVYYYEHIMSPQEKNKLLAINGVAPTAENIANRTYPFTEPVYVVTRKGIDGSTPAARLRDWLLTDEGQKLIADSGYVPIGAPIVLQQVR